MCRDRDVERKVETIVGYGNDDDKYCDDDNDDNNANSNDYGSTLPFVICKSIRVLHSKVPTVAVCCFQLVTLVTLITHDDNEKMRMMTTVITMITMLVLLFIIRTLFAAYDSRIQICLFSTAKCQPSLSAFLRIIGGDK